MKFSLNKDWIGLKFLDSLDKNYKVFDPASCLEQIIEENEKDNIIKMIIIPVSIG